MENPIIQHEYTLRAHHIVFSGSANYVGDTLRVQSVFPLSEHRVSNMMHCKIQTKFDQALFPNTNAHF